MGARVDWTCQPCRLDSGEHQPMLLIRLKLAQQWGRGGGGMMVLNGSVTVSTDGWLEQMCAVMNSTSTTDDMVSTAALGCRLDSVSIDQLMVR